ncbi:MAG: SgcJ/EcaC family oxidoreductase [Xenococcus sp. MO_188.B8]|nr:SgcJ/EcaC family oxidoreductase [Xenococcus sp. MO_188.B8]
MTLSGLTKVSDAIMAANENFMTVFKRIDAAGLADLYTEDGQVLAPNSDFLTGRESIQALWQSIFDMGVKEIKLEIIDVEDHGDTAIEVSNYTLYDDEGQELDKGKYIVIWKQRNGQWKLYRDIFNSSMPT